MEVRKRKVNITKVGGNASQNAKRAHLGLPMPWLIEMGIDSDNRDVKITFKDNKIIVEKDEQI